MESHRNTISSRRPCLDDRTETKDRILLSKAIRRSDRGAQEYIYIKFASFIRRFIKSSGDFGQQGDDLMQEVFLTLCQGKCQYLGNTDVQGYLCGIAKNVVQNYNRNKKCRISTYAVREKNASREPHQLEGKINDPEKIVQLKEFEEAVHKAVVRLPEKSRQAVALVLIHKIRPYQAAAKAGCSFVVFRNRLCHGLELLRKELCELSDFF